MGVPVRLWQQEDGETWVEQPGDTDIELTGNRPRRLAVALECEAEARAILESADPDAAADSAEPFGPPRTPASNWSLYSRPPIR